MTWATSVPILVFLGLTVLDLGPIYATDRRQTASLLNAPAYGVGHNNTILVSMMMMWIVLLSSMLRSCWLGIRRKIQSNTSCYSSPKNGAVGKVA